MAPYSYAKLCFTAGQLKSLYHTLSLGKHKTLQKFIGNLEKMRLAISIHFPTLFTLQNCENFAGRFILEANIRIAMYSIHNHNQMEKHGQTLRCQITTC